jgi:hypothetical protein
MRTIGFNTPASFNVLSDRMAADMTREVTQRGDENQEEQSHGLERLKRELWMRLLGMNGGAQSQSSAEIKPLATATSSNPRLTNH